MEKNRLLVSLLLLLLMVSCCPKNHLEEHCISSSLDIPKSKDFFLVILVDARQLDYSNNQALIRTLAKHPSDGSKNGDVGHAWIYLQGEIEGKPFILEGGHSGDLGINQPKYLEGIMNYVEFGYANPTPQEMLKPRDEPNPIKYLWSTQSDGFFQKGSGHHIPTYALKVFISKEQFHQILSFISLYDFKNYSLVGNQCSSFVAQIASLIDLSLECEMQMPIAQTLQIGKEVIVLWRDPFYSTFTFSSPDVIEKSLKELLKAGKGINVLSWYKTHNSPPWSHKFYQTIENIRLFPSRYIRYSRLTL